MSHSAESNPIETISVSHGNASHGCTLPEHGLGQPPLDVQAKIRTVCNGSGGLHRSERQTPNAIIAQRSLRRSQSNIYRGRPPRLVCAQWLIIIARQALQLKTAIERENRTLSVLKWGATPLFQYDISR